MPQMSPMMWLGFPFVMVMLVLVGVAILNSDVNVVGEMECVVVDGSKSLGW